MESQPDVQLGKIFIILWMGLMLLVIILILVVYFNAKNEASNCEPSVINTEKSDKKSDSPTPKIFIAFLVITAFAVSTMNLTYKVNYFTKKVKTPPSSPTKLLGMIQGLQQKSPDGLNSEITATKTETEQSSQ